MGIGALANQTKMQNCQCEPDRKDTKNENYTGKTGEIAFLPVYVIAFFELGQRTG